MDESTEALLVMGFGSIMLIFLVTYSIYIYKTCNVVVIGTIIALTNYGKKDSKSQFPVIGYYYNGKQYSKVTGVRSKEPLVPGQAVEIYINRRNRLVYITKALIWFCSELYR